MKQVVWQGTADVDGYDHPMRVVEDDDHKLMTEWASDSEDEDGNRVFDDTTWYADYQHKFRDKQPAPAEGLIVRMLAQHLLDA